MDDGKAPNIAVMAAHGEDKPIQRVQHGIAAIIESELVLTFNVERAMAAAQLVSEGDLRTPPKGIPP